VATHAPEDRRAFAPGRVNLIGDHTDYNLGLALPMAIGLGVEVAYRPDERDTLLIETDLEAGAGAVVPIAGPAGSLPPWARLAKAIVDQLHPDRGGAVRVSSDLPLGAGLSSSAAFGVALSLALGAELDALALARLCQRAEAAIGVPVGLMDPLVSVAGRRGRAALIDFASLHTTLVRVPEDACFTIVDSATPRTLEGSAYAARRTECETAAAILGSPLGTCAPEAVESLRDPLLRRRARHVTTEVARVRAFADSLAGNDLEAAGALMTASHRSLRDDFEVSTPALDRLVDALCALPGFLGARLTGAGFGGCVVALSRPGVELPLPNRRWSVVPSDGARLLS